LGVGALTTLALLVAIGAELLYANHWQISARPSELALVTDGLLGLSFLLVGVIVWRALPGVSVGKWMYATGLAYFIGNLAASPVPVLHHLGNALPALWFIGMGALVLAYPGDRLERPHDRLLVGGALAWIVLTGAAFVTQLDPARCLPDFCPANPFRLDLGSNLAPTISTISTVGNAVLLGLLAVQVMRRWRGATPSSRRSLTPLWLAAGVMAVAMAGGAAIEVLLGDNPASLAARLLPIVIPVVLGAGMLRARIDQASVGDLVIRLGSHPADEELAQAVARAVSDPTLILAVPGTDGQLVDLRGQAVTPPDPHRRITRVEAGNELLAVLIHDAGLDANPGLMRSVAAATRLALENRRLAATVQRQLEAVRASRARIVEASDAERERIERNLHDGAQQRLVTLALRLRMIAGGAGDAGPRRAIEDAADELDEALAELRDLARGIHPTGVVQGGLASAVEALAERTPLPVAVRVPGQRWPIGVEVAAYFVVAEALTNAVRHANATRAEVTATERDGRLRISVADDGIGGADPGTGTGLGGLVDRLAALGGSLEVLSPPGGGTVVRGDLPLVTP
jgi:signal transduction histidine kinase